MLIRRTGAALAGALLCFGIGAIVYALLAEIMPRGAVFASFYRMFLYHYAYPYQYIAVVAASYGLVLFACPTAAAKLNGPARAAIIVQIMLGSVLLASIPGGLLWKIHDMQSGFFPEGDRLQADLMWGVREGLKSGWLVVALSIPYNLIGLVLGYAVTEVLLRYRIAGLTAGTKVSTASPRRGSPDHRAEPPPPRDR